MEKNRKIYSREGGGGGWDSRVVAGKVTFILIPVSNGLEIWSINHIAVVTLKYAKLKVFKNLKLLCGISIKWPNNLSGINVY